MNMPTVSVALVSFDPAFFGAPDDANGDGIGTFPTGSHSRPFWGGGVRAGAVYSLTDGLDVGFGYTSPQWFETWTYYARTELGQPRGTARQLQHALIEEGDAPEARDQDVEGQRRFSGAGHAGDDAELVVRNVDRQRLQVVLAGVDDLDRVGPL